MLLEFKATNYKSFKDELVFSLIPAPKQKGLDYSILKTEVEKKTYKGLCSAVIYGPNASGKTHIIGAMGTFKSIVLRGNIRNDDSKNDPNVAANVLELIPNRSNHVRTPVTFSIKFIEENLLIEYGFTADLGNFLETEYPRKILAETLKINDKLVFARNSGLEIYSLEPIRNFLVNAFEQDHVIGIAKGNLNDKELFLLNGFKAMFSFKLVELITNWLKDKFVVVYRADAMVTLPKLTDPEKGTVYTDEALYKAAILFGVDSNGLSYIIESENSKPKLFSMFQDTKRAIPAELYESYGTIRFVNLFPRVVNVLLNGGILVVDEFDASIHPVALMNIIAIFHNDEINVHHAQLIFNTHNPIFLNPNLFRRDEIKFVERDEDTHCSTHYSLSDFGTTGKSGARKNEDYMKNYFVDRYGAIKDIDFTPIFESLLKAQNEA